jgi:hypothetical protein
MLSRVFGFLADRQNATSNHGNDLTRPDETEGLAVGNRMDEHRLPAARCVDLLASWQMR